MFSWHSRTSKRKITNLVYFTIFIFVSFNILFKYGRRSSRNRKWNRIQHNFGPEPRLFAQPNRQHAVRREFVHAWTAYADHGWMSDSLAPLTGSHENNFCGWSATLVDALDTLVIMGLDEEFDEALFALQNINFNDTSNDCEVNLFETTIRHLGGLLAAYDMSQDARILPKLVELGDVLHSAFDAETGMPCSHCKLMSQPAGSFKPLSRIAMAAVGSLSLEFARLSQITHDPKYMQSIMAVTQAFMRTQNDSSVPGLWPENVDATSVTGKYRHFALESYTYGLGALSDSTYEYLVKGHLLLGKSTSTYAEMWNIAKSQIKRYILFRAQVPGANTTDLIFAGNARRWSEVQDVMLEPRIQHLGCFAGGMFALASRIFDDEEDYYIGEALTNGCVWAYQNSPLGIMPESFTMLACAEDDGTQCAEDAEIWGQGEKLDSLSKKSFIVRSTLPAGFLDVTDARYLLRPEAIESVFIMWRLSGDPYWRDVGWEMFRNIRQYTWTPYGHAALEDVMETPPASVPDWRPKQRDEMESFWFAETLKYFYLLFSETDLVSLDEYVLNTEAHPLRLTDGIRGFGG